MTARIVIGYLSILVYFGILGYACFYVLRRTFGPYMRVLRRLSGAIASERVAFAIASLLIATGIVAGCSTWFYIFKFMYGTYSGQFGGDFHQWVADSDLFLGAYRLVSGTPEQWFWTVQLLFFACGYTSILRSSFGREALWWGVLGFSGAMSVSLAFFVAHLICLTQLPLDDEEDDDVPWVNPLLAAEGLSLSAIAVAALILAFAGIAVTPWLDVDSMAYAANLLAVHLLLVAALLPEPKWLRKAALSLKSWLQILAGLIFIYVTGRLLLLVGTAPASHPRPLLERILESITANDCQISVCLDLAFVFVASLLTGIWLVTREPLDEIR